MFLRPPIFTLTYTLFPYTTLFRSDCLDVVRLSDTDRGIANDVHLLASEVHQLEVLRLERAHHREPVDGPLVQSDEVLALRLCRVAFHRAEVPDVVEIGRQPSELQSLMCNS